MRFYDFTTLVSMRKLVRLLEVTDGDDVPMEFCCDARPNYGARSATWKQTLEEPFAFFCGEATLFTNIPIGANLHRRFMAEPSKLYFAMLDYSPTPRPPSRTFERFPTTRNSGAQSARRLALKAF